MSARYLAPTSDESLCSTQLSNFNLALSHHFKLSNMRPVLLVPGIGNSSSTHWQSLWERRHPNVLRVVQEDWEMPVCEEWVNVLANAISRSAEPPILAAHSLGCLVVARWAAQSDQQIHAALLVAVPDPDGPKFPAAASGFDAVPSVLPGRRITMVSSTNDPYSSPQYSHDLAERWQAEHVSLGAFGHINAASGLEHWPEGWSIVSRWRQEQSPAAMK